MTHIQIELPHYILIQIGCFSVTFVRLVGPVHDFGHDAFQVLDAISARQYCIVTQVFVLITGIIPVTFRTESIAFIFFQFADDPLVHVGNFSFGCLIFGHPAVSPFDGPVIVHTDAGEDSGTGNAIFGLRYVIETCIVHDRRSMTVGFHPCFIP